jgi:hypothetical protein
MNTGAEIQARMREATPVMNSISAAFDAFMARQPRRPAFRVVAKPFCPGHRGKRARRQAFYQRQRTARVLQRVMLGADLAVFERAWVEACSSPYGMSWLELSAAGPRRIDPRTVFFGFDGQEVPPPDGSPSDADIAGLRRIFTIDANTPFSREISGTTPDGKVMITDTFYDPEPTP